MLCRVLLGLDRAEATGTLLLQGQGRSATVSLEEGHLVGANIDRRVASSAQQLLESIAHACKWNDLVLRFAQTSTTTTWWKLGEPIAARALALECIRVVVSRVDHSTMQADLGSRFYCLTESGEALLRGAALCREESAVVFWLRRGVDAEDVATLPGCGLRGYRFLFMLKLLGGAAPKQGGSYPLLLRKRREMRRQAPPRELLDLPKEARSGDARRALRKLVRDLHPDRFSEGVPLALRRASSEIVTALIDAQAALASERAD
jgi:hypothetical protein